MFLLLHLLNGLMPVLPALGRPFLSSSPTVADSERLVTMDSVGARIAASLPHAIAICFTRYAALHRLA
jgi:hypothetical protein